MWVKMSEQSEDESVKPWSLKLKNEKKIGRLSNPTKQLKTRSHALGEDCKCTMVECFENK